MHYLVVGGAGYIGSQMAKQLSRDGHRVTVFDSLATGFAELARYGELVTGDLADREALKALFAERRFDAVIDFAAFSQVGESMSEPARYYRNNVAHTLNLLDAMVAHGVKRLVFSSTAAVYGSPDYTPIDERHPTRPINPYGHSKLMVETVLADYARSYGLSSVALRYFNAAGADPEGELGELHDPETHLIPLVLQGASGRRASIKVFGRDYPTPDGTCIRDYIHIDDLCRAHALALQQLTAAGDGVARCYNLGNGQGFSVQAVIDVATEVVGRDGYSLTVEEAPRRAGDPAVLVADASRARTELGWQPQYADLTTIIEHAWAWEKRVAGIG